MEPPRTPPPLAEISATVFRALEYAAKMHEGQVRKGKRPIPYVNHLISVLSILSATGHRDPVLLAAAALHDVIEDTPVTRADLDEIFPPDIVDLVVEVTDDKTKPYAERKHLQIYKAPHLSPRAKAIKIADRIANVLDIGSDPPMSWDLPRQEDYVTWSEAVVLGCRDVNGPLGLLFDRTAKAVREAIRRRRAG